MRFTKERRKAAGFGRLFRNQGKNDGVARIEWRPNGFPNRNNSEDRPSPRHTDWRSTTTRHPLPYTTQWPNASVACGTRRTSSLRSRFSDMKKPNKTAGTQKRKQRNFKPTSTNVSTYIPYSKEAPLPPPHTHIMYYIHTCSSRNPSLKFWM